MKWEPNPGPQTRFLASSAHEVLYGGAAGGGKSAGLVAGAVRWVGHKHFRGLILRRETTDLGKLWSEAQAIYPVAVPGARPREDVHTWRFPSGAIVRFNHCQREADALGYLGDEFQYLGFDELTLFTRTQYLAIKSRVRSPHPGLPRFIRNTSNPGGPGHAWVLERWGPWLNPECEVEGLPPRFGPDGRRLPPATPGLVLWYLTRKGDELEQVVPPGTVDDDGTPAQSRTFIPATLADNPVLAKNDPAYLQNIRSLDPVRRAQLEDGNWLKTATAGTMFQRDWFEVVPAAPARMKRVRAWDLAATAPSRDNPDPDWTQGVRVGRAEDGVFYVEDLRSLRGVPGAVQSLVKTIATQDPRGTRIRLPQDPGQAGVDQAAAYVKLLAGYDVRTVRPTGEKSARASPASAQAYAKNIKLVRGAWNEMFLAEVHAFPTFGVHDDIVDALSDAIAELSHGGPALAMPADVSGLSQRNTWSV